jgi:protein-S-isoprenylcysteine O-methyltransferase
MRETVHTICFYLLLACWFLFIVGFVAARSKKEAKEKSQKRDRRATIGILLKGVSFAIVFWIRRPYDIPLFPKAPAVSAVIEAAAVVVAGLSVFIILWAIRVLGKEWSPSARIITGHRLVTEGPYRYVRHPIYSGMFGLMAATGALVCAQMVLPVAVALYLIGFYLRIVVEENLLLQHFGTGYEDYREKVKALIPFLI